MLPYATGPNSFGRHLSKHAPADLVSSHINEDELLRNLAPGGYGEFNELDPYYTSPDGSLKEDSDIFRLNRLFIDTSNRNGADPGIGPRLEGLMKEAGFVNVTVAKHAMPYGAWPADEHLVCTLS